MQAYSRTGNQVLKRFKKEPKHTRRSSDGFTPRTSKGSAWQRAIKRLDYLLKDMD